MSLQEQYIIALVKKGWVVNPVARTTKYVELSKAGMTDKIFVGSRGAVRAGPNVSSSVPTTAAWRKRLLDASKELEDSRKG